MNELFARFALPKKIGWRDHAIGFALAAVYVGWLLGTAYDLGFARDEGFYFRAATDYSRWFELLFTRPKDAMQRGAIDSIWATNHEHPSLMKSLFSLSWMLFHEKWKIFKDASTAFRFPGMVMMGVATWVTYLFGARAFSRRAGVIGAVLLGLMPNVFYNAHLACFDVPIMAMWVWCIYVYWRSQQEGGLAWALAAGLMYGLTLETKHNAWILPAVFIPHAIVAHGAAMRRQLRVGRLPLPASLVAMATIGPLVFYALWPWMWNDTLPRIQEYVNFHMNHEYYTIEFLGVSYFSAPSPRAYMPVMIAATVPTVTLVLFAVGAFDRLKAMALRAYAIGLSVAHQLGKTLPAKLAGAERADRAETDILIFLSLCAPLAVFLLPKTPIFGGTKHWLTAYPFLCMLAGRGFDRVADAMDRALPALKDRARVGAHAGLVAAVIAGPFFVTRHSHPFGLSAYVPLVGGTAGGADLGLVRQFWGFTTQSLAPYFANVPPNSTVYFHDTAWDSWARLIDEKRLRPDLRGVGAPSDADYAIVHHELHMAEVDYNIWGAFGSDIPDYVLTHDGVPIISVYKRRR